MNYKKLLQTVIGDFIYIDHVYRIEYVKTRLEHIIEYKLEYVKIRLEHIIGYKLEYVQIIIEYVQNRLRICLEWNRICFEWDRIC